MRSIKSCPARHHLLALAVLLGLAVVAAGCSKKEQPRTSGRDAVGSDRVSDVSPADDRDFRATDSTGVTNASDLPADVADANRRGDLGDTFFAYDSWSLSPEAREILAKNADHLSRHSGWRITIEGHCDERGTREYNLALGEKRAAEARRYLVSLGIEPARIAVVSFGKDRPFVAGRGEETWSKNRRAHFVVTAL